MSMSGVCVLMFRFLYINGQMLIRDRRVMSTPTASRGRMALGPRLKEDYGGEELLEE